MIKAYSQLSSRVIERTVSEVNRQQKFGPRPEEESPFKQVLDSMNSGKEFAANVGIDNQQMGMPSSNVQAISAQNINIDPANIRIGINEPNGMDMVVDMLSDVNKGQMKMEQMVNEILFSGKRFSNQELLAIQAHVFHFAQVSELVVKAADQGVSSVKAVLNTNVQ